MKVALLPGDGIGRKSLPRRAEYSSARLEAGDAGSRGRRRRLRCRRGSAARRHLSLAKEADAILFGAVAGRATTRCRGPSALSRRCCGCAGTRAICQPAPGAGAPAARRRLALKAEVVAGLDILIVRELTGDIYFGEPRASAPPATAAARASTPCATARPRCGASRRWHSRRHASAEAGLLGRQGQCARDFSTVARGDDGRGEALPRRRAYAHVRRQLRHAAGAQSKQFDVIVTGNMSATSSPTRRRCSPDRSACCPRPRSTPAARGSTSRSRLGAGHRGERRGEPLGHHPLCGDDAAILPASAAGRRAHRSRSRQSLERRTAHCRHPHARNAQGRHRRDGRRGCRVPIN